MTTLSNFLQITKGGNEIEMFGCEDALYVLCVGKLWISQLGPVAVDQRLIQTFPRLDDHKRYSGQ